MSSKVISYTLPDLPYAYDAMSPVLSEQAMHLHHDKHHASYVKGANETLEQLAALDEGENPSPLLKRLAFNVGGHVLHSLYWTSISPTSTKPTPALTAAINASFGSVGTVSALLSGAIANLAGSGWAALVWEPVGGRLVVTQLHDHQGDVIAGSAPILAFDGWEHAYYLDYQADRAKWSTAIVEVANWSTASQRFAAITSPT
jgi:superoxide dismutase, Fe-Mn family